MLQDLRAMLQWALLLQRETMRGWHCGSGAHLGYSDRSCIGCTT